MAVNASNNIMREHLALSYGAKATHGAIYTTVPVNAAGTEPGAPYVRKPLNWTAGTVDGTVTATVEYDLPAGATVRGGGVHDSLQGGNYLDGGAVTEQTFATAGKYTLTYTNTVQ